MKCINLLGRVIVIDQGNVLLVKKNNAVFLPGGHVEHNEGVTQTIIRECEEEFKGEVSITDFVGVLEHSFPVKEGIYHEINMIFTGVLKNVAYPDKPESNESDLEVFWWPLEDIEKSGLLPEKMIKIIMNNLDRKSYWASSMIEK